MNENKLAYTDTRSYNLDLLFVILAILYNVNFTLNLTLFIISSICITYNIEKRNLFVKVGYIRWGIVKWKISLYYKGFSCDKPSS